MQRQLLGAVKVCRILLSCMIHVISVHSIRIVSGTLFQIVAVGISVLYPIVVAMIAHFQIIAQWISATLLSIVAMLKYALLSIIYPTKLVR